VSLRTSRSDCDKYSPRNSLTAEGGFFSISKRGKVTVWSCYKVTNPEETKRHYARMLRADVR
jgi:hypothetical protein